MNNTQRSASMADSYRSMYLEEKVSAPAKPEELPAYKRLQTAIADRKKLGNDLNDNPWKANPADHKGMHKEEIDELVSYLIDEGCTDDEDDAMVIIEHMSEEWFEHIMEKMTDKELRQAALDSVRNDTITKHGKDSIISGKVSKGPKDKAKYSDNSDSETKYKKTYGNNKSFWD